MKTNFRIKFDYPSSHLLYLKAISLSSISLHNKDAQLEVDFWCTYWHEKENHYNDILERGSFKCQQNDMKRVKLHFEKPIAIQANRMYAVFVQHVGVINPRNHSEVEYDIYSKMKFRNNQDDFTCFVWNLRDVYDLHFEWGPRKTEDSFQQKLWSYFPFGSR
jgi:hypothetical protein